MQQLNVYGCRGYLVNVASNQNIQLLSIVISEYDLNLQWSNSETENQTHWDPYALHDTACAWWHHSPTLLFIFRTSSRHLHQSVLWEYIQQYQITIRDCLSFSEAWLMTIFSNFVLLSMFKGGFFPLGFCLFPCLNGHALCKGWLSLVSRPYNFLIYYS